MNQLTDLIKGSTIIQGLVTLMILGVICYLIIKGQPVPELLIGTAGTLIGFWFGTKVPYNVSKSLDDC